MNPNQIDPKFVDKIVQEVKSQGVFDEFRKDSIADVDTKPAYQNLRQRVETSVKEFLSKQIWTPDMNKNQLRERLRRHISESGYLDVGVDRIVDQVVNPKIATVFRPRIEEIAYNCLGITPPPSQARSESTPLLHSLPPLPLNGAQLTVDTSGVLALLPTDLEQISPDSDKIVERSNGYDDMDIEEEKPEDEEESPPFEPLVISSGIENPKEEATDEADLSAVDSNIKIGSQDGVDTQQLNIDTQDSTTSGHTPEQESGNFKKEPSRSLDAMASQGSRLSQISSNRRISPDGIESNVPTEQSSLNDPVAVNISEEAQMPKFSENSSEGANSQPISQLHFDIKKDEIKFEGTERKASLLPTVDENVDAERTESGDFVKNDTTEDKTDMDAPSSPFKFAKISAKTDRATIVKENISPSSLDDTDSNNMFIVEKTSERNKTPVPTSTATECVTTPSSPSLMPPREKKEESRRSSSHHSKHSKEKRRSRERDDKGSRHRERSRERDSRSKYSSSSSKYSSPTKRTSHRSHDAERSSKSTKHSNYTSSCSSSRSGHDSKRDKYKRDEKNRSDSHHKDDSRRKSSATNDDHNESREKLRKWRKSTDSNDDEKSPGRGMGGRSVGKSAYKTSLSSSKSSSTNMKMKSKTSSDSKSHANKDGSDLKDSSDKHRSNVVILNDILQHPSTNFIELETASHAKRVQVVTRSTATPSALSANSPTNSDISELACFEENLDPFKERLIWLNGVIERLRRDSNDNVPKLYDDKHVETSSVETGYKECKKSTGATVDEGGAAGGDEVERGMRKLFKPDENCANETSPTPSDGSANSKENEIYDKNAVNPKQDHVVDERQHHAMTKLSQQQRYTSEDLYKPRPVLSQRSKRRNIE